MDVGPFIKGGNAAEITVFGKSAIAIAEAKTLPYMADGFAGYLVCLHERHWLQSAR